MKKPHQINTFSSIGVLQNESKVNADLLLERCGRMHPDKLFPSNDLIARARKTLNESLALYQKENGNFPDNISSGDPQVKRLYRYHKRNGVFGAFNDVINLLDDTWKICEVDMQFKELYDLLGLIHCENLASVKNCLSAFGTFTRAIGDFLPTWTLFEGLDRLFGYTPDYNVLDFKDHLLNWIKGPFSIEKVDDEKWRSRWDASLHQVITHNFGKISDSYVSNSIDDYVNYRSQIGKSGSSSIKLRINGKTYGNKWGTAYSESNASLKNMIQNTVSTTVKVIAKLESGAKSVRQVAGTDFASFIQQDYVNGILKHFYIGDQFHAYNSAFRDLNYIDYELRMVDSGYWFVPIDMSKFDFNVSKYMIHSIFDKLSEYLMIDSNDAEIVKKCGSTIADCRFIYKDGGIDEWIRKGLMSGHRLTSFMGSIVSLCLLNMSSPMEKVVLSRSLGDDVDLVIKGNCFDVNDILDRYNNNGSTLSKSKLFLSQKRNEFLKRIIDKNGVTGYPIRMLTSILYMKPDKPEPLDTNYDKGYEVISKWKTFIDRCGHKYSGRMTNYFMNDIISDVVGATKLDRISIIKSMGISVITGGYGFTGNDASVSVIKHVISNDKSDLDLNVLPEFRLRYNKWTSRTYYETVKNAILGVKRASVSREVTISFEKIIVTPKLYTGVLDVRCVNDEYRNPALAMHVMKEDGAREYVGENIGSLDDKMKSAFTEEGWLEYKNLLQKYTIRALSYLYDNIKIKFSSVRNLSSGHSSRVMNRSFWFFLNKRAGNQGLLGRVSIGYLKYLAVRVESSCLPILQQQYRKLSYLV